MLAGSLAYTIARASSADARPSQRVAESEAVTDAVGSLASPDLVPSRIRPGSRPARQSSRRSASSVSTDPRKPGGARTFAPSAGAISRSLEQTTGLTPAQVTARDVCPPAPTGQARCEAQALVVRSDGRLVQPHVGRHASIGRVGPALGPTSATRLDVSSSSPPEPGTPAFLEQAYDLAYLSQTHGGADTVAIVDAYDDPSAQTDLNTYRSAYGLPACTASSGCFRKVNQTGGASPLPAGDPGWEQEESLDLDAVSAVCANCRILLVEANSASLTDLKTAMATAASIGANQISASWTATSDESLPGTYTFPHVATVAATGDTGYPGAGADNYPAAFPGVTAAGGTTLTAADAGSNLRGFSEGAWSLSDGYGGGSGCDLQVAKPTYQLDSGCAGRSYADVSADADPSTGLVAYDSGNGGWMVLGGTSLATPLVAAYYAITGVTASSPRWAYTDSSLLNDLTTGYNGACAADITYICNAGAGYDGPTGVGSISGDLVTGAPGIGGAAIQTGSSQTYTESVASHSATIAAGIYRNGRDTTWSIQYGTTTAYGSQTAATDIGSGTAPDPVTGYLSQLAPATTYHYRLVAQNSLGTTYGYDYTFTTAVASPTDPTASFTASPTTPAPGGWTSFDASNSTDASSSISDYSWNFGDGTTADTGTTTTVGHSYTNRGNYNVTLTVTNALGQTDTGTETVRIDDPPTAVFSPSTTVAQPGSTVGFDGTASDAGAGGTITDYSWNFGDGTTLDTGTTPTAGHVYAAPGVYTVKLTTTDDLGVAGKVSEEVTVDEPTAAFTSSPDSSVPGTPVGFDATGSSDPEATILDYSWNFGDGTGIEDDQSSPTTSHTYGSRGHFNVTLTITNSLGQTDTSSETVTIDDPPTAAFSPSVSVTEPGSSVDLDGTASAAGAGGTITDYTWNFGDGGTDDMGTSPADSHIYTAPGIYTTTLTTTDDLGVTAHATAVITVDHPNAAFIANPTEPLPEAATSFDASISSDSEATITNYSWDFGDGTPVEDDGSSASTSHTYAHRGHYDVTLTVTNALGQTDTAGQTLTVDDPPTATVSPSTVLSAAGATVTFTGSAAAGDPDGTITDYRWAFGDGSFDDTGMSPTDRHVYTNPGVYTATLTATDDLGETTSTARQITVDAAPAASFITSPNPQALGAVTSFDAQGSSDSLGTITSYTWNFGDGTVGIGPVTSHTYGTPGNYTVVLTVTNGAGQATTRALSVTVEPRPTVTATPTPDPAPRTSAPQLSGSLSGTRNQRLGFVLKHGLRVRLSASLRSHASFQVTVPTGRSGRTGEPPRRRLSSGTTRSIILLRIRTRLFKAGAHVIMIKLSPAAARQLSGRSSMDVTVQVTLVDAFGSRITRLVTITLHRSRAGAPLS